ncbi:MAG: insulinase family protein, partial [Verrucomicrobiales bacterium]|nr:insulinase family protein [Verrucomicrobiales bacterium]
VADRQPAAADQQSSALEQVTLQNGSPLVLKQDAKVPLVTVRVILSGGLLDESSELNGIGTLTARLLDKGTATRSAAQIASEIENLGGSFSASNGNNSMSIAIEVLSADVDKAVDLLTDMFLNPTFPAAEVDKEKTKQLADIKMETDEPMALARNALREGLYGEQRTYGRPALGTVDSVKRITRDDIKKHFTYLVHNHPARPVFTVSGSFDRAAVIKLLNAKMPNKPFLAGSRASEIVEFHGTGQTVIVPTNKQQAIVEIGYPGVTVSDPDRPALELINAALSDLASRLFIRIREQQSLAYFVGTNQMLGLQPGYFMFYAGTEAAKGEKVCAELLDEIKNLTASGFSSEEIERARAKLLGQRLWQDQSADVIAYKAGLNILYSLGLDYEASLNDRLKTLTVAEVNAVAKKYFSANNYVTVIVQPNQNFKAQTPISK